MSNGIGNANPLDAGSDANSVESAAADFTRMLQEENAPLRSEPARNTRSRPSEPSTPQAGDADGLPRGATEDAAPGPARADDGHDADDDTFDDPILGKAAADANEADEEADKEGDGTADDTDETDDETDDGDLDLDREVDVTVAGEALKVPLKEVIAGYSREADYRQKTARLAEERREVEEYAEEVVQERQKYAGTLTEWVERTKALEPSKEDWDRLKASDPQTFIAVKEQWEGINAKVNEAKAELERVAATQAAEAQRQYAQYVRAENAKLLEKIPALANPKKATEFRKAILTYGKAAGYSEEELTAGAVNHRDILTLYKAARYDEIVRSRKAGQRPPKQEPKPSPTSTPRNVATRRGNSNRVDARREAERRLARTGSVDDAALAFTRMLEQGS